MQAKENSVPADVELVDATKSYGQFKAVDNVSLTIEKGSFVSLLGSSGAGKSTVLRIIGGFEFLDYGSVHIAGKDVTMLPPYRRDVNTVFQNYALFPHMTTAENVAYGLRQAGVAAEERKRRVREALSMVAMLPLAERKPNQLSGGQQQRVALARALVNRPSVLLLDEPLAALDRQLRQQVQVELKLLQKRLGLTFVFVTHDQEEALAMSDLIAVMRNGRIEQIGTPTELYDEPATAFVAGFVGAQNFVPGVALDGGGAMRDHSGTVLKVGYASPGIVAGTEVLGAVRPEHVRISETEPDPSFNCLRAHLIATVMLGETVEIVATVAGGGEFRCRLPRRNLSLPPPSSEIWFFWDPEFFRMLAFDPEVAPSAKRGI